MSIQGSSLNLEQLREKAKEELVGNIAVFMNGKLVLRSKPTCARIRINAPAISSAIVKNNYAIVSLGKSVAIYVDNRPVPKGLYNDPYFIYRPIDVVIHYESFNDMAENTMELLLFSKDAEQCDFKAGEKRLVLSLDNNEVDIYAFGKENCIVISGGRDAVMKYHFFIKPYSILTSCDKDVIMQIINAPREFIAPQLPIQTPY